MTADTEALRERIVDVTMCTEGQALRMCDAIEALIDAKLAALVDAKTQAAFDIVANECGAPAAPWQALGRACEELRRQCSALPNEPQLFTVTVRAMTNMVQCLRAATAPAP